MLKKEVESVLNSQIAYEARSSSLYLSLASWCESEGLEGCADFFYHQSEEERMHKLRLFKYINESGGRAVVPEVPAPQKDFESVLAAFQLFLKSEEAITEAINGLIEVCNQQKDYKTLNFLQWYISEQHEEETLARTILDKIKIIGNQPGALYLIDNEIKNIKSKGVESPALPGEES